VVRPSYMQEARFLKVKCELHVRDDRVWIGGTGIELGIRRSRVGFHRDGKILGEWDAFSHSVRILLDGIKNIRVSFFEGSFYDNSLLRPLSSRTEHSQHVVHHCRNWSVLSLLSALLALFRCALVSSFSILAQFF